MTPDTSSNIAPTSAITDAMSSSIVFNPSASMPALLCSLDCLISISLLPQVGSGDWCKSTAGEVVVSIGANFSSIALDHSFLELFTGVVSRKSSLSSISAVLTSMAPMLSFLRRSIPFSTGDLGVPLAAALFAGGVAK